jgi:hypothetical protein
MQQSSISVSGRSSRSVEHISQPIGSGLRGRHYCRHSHAEKYGQEHSQEQSENLESNAARYIEGLQEAKHISIRSLSMSLTFRLQTSDARNPAP